MGARLMIALGCVVMMGGCYGSSGISGEPDSSVDPGTDAGSDPPADVADEDDCLVDIYGRIYERSDFYLCEELEGCLPPPDPLCPEVIPCPGTPCEPDTSPHCEYCQTDCRGSCRSFAWVYCDEDTWSVDSLHCDDCFEDSHCDDGDPCTSDVCIDYWCTNEAVDADEDGHPAAEVDGVPCDGDDCDDSDPDIWFGC